MSAKTDLPEYECHKRVRAAKITAIDADDEGHLLTLAGSDWKAEVPRGWVREKRAKVGGYYVVYDDGYESFSPAQAFEAGYTRVEATDGA